MWAYICLKNLSRSQHNSTSFFQVGIIGGSGFYNLEELKIDEEVAVETEFGHPSDKFVIGKIGRVDCVVLAR